MRNSSIVLSFIGLSVLVFGLITSFIVKNQQVATMAVLASVVLFGVSGLLTTFGTPSSEQILENEFNQNSEMNSIWERIRDVQNQCNRGNDDNYRWYQNELDSLYTRLEDLEQKKK
jgi:hypothetical protein